MKKNYKIIAIIQARMKSRRLPNKSLIDLSGKPNILRMVDRVKLSKLINKTIIATSDEFEDDVISIFIEPPGEDLNEQIETIQKRLKDRGHESETLIKQRTKRLQLEVEYKDKFNHHFVNDDLKKTTDKIEKAIRRKLK